MQGARVGRGDTSRLYQMSPNLHHVNSDHYDIAPKAEDTYSAAADELLLFLEHDSVLHTPRWLDLDGLYSK